MPELEQAVYRKETLLKDITRRIFARFSQSYWMWRRAIDVLSELDCLGSLAITSLHQEGACACPLVCLPACMLCVCKVFYMQTFICAYVYTCSSKQ